MDIIKAYTEYEAVRTLGQTNMYDSNMVQIIAFHNKFYDLVQLIEAKKYSDILNDYSKYIKIIEEEKISIPIAKEVRYCIQK